MIKVPYPQYMDDTDIELSNESHRKSMQEFYKRLIKQIEEKGITNCGHTSKEKVKKIFQKYLD